MTTDVNANFKSQLNNYNNVADIKLSNKNSNLGSDMKVQRPSVNVVDAPTNLAAKNKFSYLEAKKQLDSVNNDIYIGTKNEQSKHKFDTNKYFTIFGILGIITAVITYFRRK